MSWGLVAAAGATVVGSMISSNSANKAAAGNAKAANTSAYKDYTNNVNTTMENNKAISEANTTNMIRAGFKVGLVQLQTARLKEQAAQEGFAASRSASEALAATDANAAASGTVGASIDAVSNDIKKRSEEAQIAITQNWYQTVEDQGIAMEQTITEAADHLQSTQNVPDIDAVGVSTPQQVSVLGNMAGSLLSLYANSQMSLGKGGAAKGAASGGGGYSYGAVLGGIGGSYGLTG